MKLDGRFEYKKALILAPDRVKELEAILLKYCKEVSYEATTVADTDISFTSVDELFSYDNFQNRRIKSLTVTGRIESKRIAVCEFEAERLTPFVGYDETCICRYTVPNVDTEITLKADILAFLKKSTASFWPLSKFRLFGLFAFVVLYLFFPVMFLVRADYADITEVPSMILMGMIAILFSFLVVKAVRAFDQYILEKLYPPITFLWGEEQTRYEKNDRIRKNIIWCVLIAAIISIIAGIITFYITKQLSK